MAIIELRDLPCFVEGQRTERGHFFDALGLNETDGFKLIDELGRRRLLDSGLEVTGTAIVFKFVGYVSLCNCEFWVSPKIDRRRPEGFARNRRGLILRTVAKRVSSFKRTQVASARTGEDEDTDVGVLALVLAALEDFAKSGLYHATINRLELNGEGPINWEATVNETVPWRTANGFAYFDLVTTWNDRDEDNYFRALHAEAVGICRSWIEMNGLDELSNFDNRVRFEPPQTSNRNVAKAKLRAQIRRTFNDTQRAKLEHTLAVFTLLTPGQRNSLILGTRKFENVWEAATQELLGNQFRIGASTDKLDPNLLTRSTPIFYGNDFLPSWEIDEGACVRTDQLLPDIVIGEADMDGVLVAILDAKYYDLDFSAPGVADISKQHLYQLGLETALSSLENVQVANVFLVPSAEEKMSLRGVVSVPYLCALGAIPIQVMELPLYRVLDEYVSSTPFDYRSAMMTELEFFSKSARRND